MLAAVDLDDQHGFDADEIDHIMIADRLLLAKLEPAQTTIANRPPNDLFDICAFAPEANSMTTYLAANFAPAQALRKMRSATNPPPSTPDKTHRTCRASTETMPNRSFP